VGGHDAIELVAMRRQFEHRSSSDGSETYFGRGVSARASTHSNRREIREKALGRRRKLGAF